MYHYQLLNHSQCCPRSWALQMNLLVHKMKVVILTNVLTGHLGGEHNDTWVAPGAPVDGQLRSGQVQSRSLCPNTHDSVTLKCKIFTTTQME